MKKNISSVLNEALLDITPSQELMNFMKNKLDLFMDSLEKRIKKLNIEVEPSVGGSYAKNTMIKKGTYDIDVFLRFSKKYSEEQIPKLAKKLLKKTKHVSIVHGSRPYFQIKFNQSFKIEVVPVKKVNSPKESKNITDLSYSHAKYINSKIKSKKILDEIKIAKAFTYAAGVYGAESYINGFSGYSLELLIYHFKTFEKFLKALSKKKQSKIIIDIEKFYKKPKDVLIELNSSKLSSPIILIDPTYKQRNVAASLSNETFRKFQKTAKEFLKNPSKDFFSKKIVDITKIRENAKKENLEFLIVSTKTKKQAGDIAGAKLKKFYNHLKEEINKYFIIKKTGFNYTKNFGGKAYFVVKKKKEIVFNGPEEKDIKNVEKFKKNHKEIYKEKGRIYSKKKIVFSLKEFLTLFKKQNRKKIKQMYITKIKFKD